jgi:hypothetical protein
MDPERFPCAQLRAAHIKELAMPFAAGYPRSGGRKVKKSAKTISSESLRRTLMPLRHRGFDTDDLSAELAKWGSSPDNKTLDRILRGESERTHRITGSSSVLFDNLFEKDMASNRVARLAHHIHELIGSARRDSTRPDDLANALEAADDLCAICRPSATDIVAGILDFLEGVAKLTRVAAKCDVKSRDEALGMLQEAMSLLKSSIERLRPFSSDDDSDGDSGYVDVFLIPAYENLLACASELDERSFNCPFNSSHNPRTATRGVVIYLNLCGAMKALRQYAENYNCAIVAYNLAEYAGLTDDQHEVERAFLLCFKLRRPTANGEWRLPGMTDDPRNISYLCAGFHRALEKFKQRKEQSSRKGRGIMLKKNIRRAGFSLLVYTTGVSTILSALIAEVLAAAKPIIH